MPTKPEQAPIIIIKRKKVAAAAHHGGAWKVAYADFVTAMMALFIVLWLLNSSHEIQKAVGGYFKDPSGRSKEVGNGQANAGDSIAVSQMDMGSLKDKIQQQLKTMPELQKLQNQVLMTVTGEGLRIELLETENGFFFQTGSAQPSEVGKKLLTALAAELGKLSNGVLVEGHTDSRPYSANGRYSNWELSVDRANAARRHMEEFGMKAGQINQVRGFADRSLRKPGTPQDATNRRISVVVQYDKPVESAPVQTAAAAPHH